MIKIKKGNSFIHNWAINWNGVAEDFSDATDIVLTYNVLGRTKEFPVEKYKIEGNIIKTECTPEICDWVGQYRLELKYTKPSAEFSEGERRSAVDVRAFQIVETSDQADATQDISVTSDAVAGFALKYEDLTDDQKDELRGKGIASIQLTAEDGDVKTYTITYADGLTFDFPVRDGHSPIFSFDGTTLLIDGVPQFDLKGETGNGIASVELLSTVGLVKTYRITFTDSTKTTFVVTDGSTPVITFQGTTIYVDGVAGPDLKGETGKGITSVELLSTVGLAKTYRITFTDATTFDYVVMDGAAGTGATVVQTTGGSLVDVMSQKAVTDEIAQLAGEVSLKLDKTAVKQTTGTSETDLMSQKAVTDELNNRLYIKLEEKTDFYELTKAEENKLVMVTNSNNLSFLLPDDATVDYRIGSKITIYQNSTGSCTVLPKNVNISIVTAGGVPSTNGIYTSFTLIKKAVNVWMLTGDYVLVDGTNLGYKQFTVYGKNLFNKDTVFANTILYSTGAVLVNLTSSTSDFIELDQKQIMLTISGLTAHTGASQLICWYDSNKTFISYTGFTEASTEVSFVVPLTAKYIRFSLSRQKTSGETINLNTIQCEYYGKSTYEAFSLTTPNKMYVPADGEQTFKLIPNRNYFDKTKYYVNCEAVATGGILYRGSESQCSGYIDIPTDARFVYFSGMPTFTGSNRIVVFYDINKTFISYSGLANGFSERVIKIPTNAKYLVFDIIIRKTSGETINLDTIQCEFYGQTDFENYTPTLKDRTLYLIQDIATWGKKMLCFGDSIMETALNWTTDGTSYNEATRMNSPLFVSGYLKLGDLRNYAMAGGRWVDGNQIIDRQKISVQITTALTHYPTADIIVINMGTNDSFTQPTLGSFATAMTKTNKTDLDRSIVYEAIRWAMWTLRDAYPNAVKFVGSVLDTSAQNQGDFIPINIAIKEMAEQYGFIYVNQGAECGITKDVEAVSNVYLSDGLHPNYAGAVLLGKYWANKIVQQFN